MNRTDTSGEDSADVPPNAADTAPDDTIVVRTTTATRTQPRTCAACGTALTQPPVGRPRRWCSPACRTRGWAHRRAAGTTPPDQVVHDRVTTTTRVVEPRLPRWPYQWCRTLDGLLEQLADRTSILNIQHGTDVLRDRLQRAIVVIDEMDAYLEDAHRTREAHREAHQRAVDARFRAHLREPVDHDDAAAVDHNEANPEPDPQPTPLSRQQRRALERQRKKDTPPTLF